MWFFPSLFFSFFFFNDTATTEIYTLSLHDALPIPTVLSPCCVRAGPTPNAWARSEEHTSELQSRLHLVCRLLLEKKKKTAIHILYKKQQNKNKKTKNQQKIK